MNLDLVIANHVQWKGLAPDAINIIQFQLNFKVSIYQIR
jgi:hypothetical protein